MDDSSLRLLCRPRSQPPSYVLLCCSPMFSRGAIYPPHAMQYLNTSPGSDVTIQSATSQNLWSTQGKCYIAFVRHRHWENDHLLKNLKQSPHLFLLHHCHVFIFNVLFVVFLLTFFRVSIIIFPFISFTYTIPIRTF